MPKFEIDQPTRDRIEVLVKEEYRLLQQLVLADADHRRLREIHLELDQYWDMFRHRRRLRASPPRPIDQRTSAGEE